MRQKVLITTVEVGRVIESDFWSWGEEGSRGGMLGGSVYS